MRLFLLFVMFTGYLIIPFSLTAKNLVFNGDFEIDSGTSPPLGWKMWGAEKFKNSSNFIRNEEHAKNGKACFKIFHPKNTEGYVVTDPQFALRPKKGRSYSVSFWIKAEETGKSIFGITGYKSVNPLSSDTSDFYLIDVETEWKYFSFTFTDTLHFFSQQSRYILLTFKAADRDIENTVYLDDINISEIQSNSSKPQLVNQKTFNVRLNHRLAVGPSLHLAINPKKRKLQNKCISGISFHRLSGWAGLPFDSKGLYKMNETMVDAIRNLRLPISRIYGLGDESYSIEKALEMADFLCREYGIPQRKMILELENQGAKEKMSLEEWERAISYANKNKLEFKYWEISNEPYKILSKFKSAFPSPDTYVEHFINVSKLIKNICPDFKTGIAFHPENVRWGNYILKKAAGHYDFAVGHYYSTIREKEVNSEDIVLAANWKILKEILRYRKLLEKYNTQKVFQIDTEWGLHSRKNGKKADDVVQNGNIIGVLHRAVRMIYYAREKIIDGASSWEMFCKTESPGFGSFYSDDPDKISMLYLLYYYFNRHLGKWNLSFDGQTPYYRSNKFDEKQIGPVTPVLVSEDPGKIYVIVVNGSFKETIPCTIKFRAPINVKKIHIIQLNHNDPNTSPVLSARKDYVKEEVLTEADFPVWELAPHSVYFITFYH